MKKSLILIVACIFAFATVHAQNSEVETATQLTKAEQFLAKTSLVKKETVYKHQGGGLKILARVFTDMKTGEKIAALEFQPSSGAQLLANGLAGHLGYLDMENVDDLLLALETILAETNSSSKKDEYTLTYTAPGGIDVSYFLEGGILNGTLYFRRKSYYINEFGVRTEYTAGSTASDIKTLPKLIDDIKESKRIALQMIAQE